MNGHSSDRSDGQKAYVGGAGAVNFAQIRPSAIVAADCPMAQLSSRVSGPEAMANSMSRSRNSSCFGFAGARPTAASLTAPAAAIPAKKAASAAQPAGLASPATFAASSRATRQAHQAPRWESD